MKAAALLYAPETPARGWQILHAPGLGEDEARQLRLGHLGGPVYIRPDRGQPVPAGALIFPAADPDTPAQVAQFWDLSALQARYRDLIARFGALPEALQSAPLSDEAALVVRLLLVHCYRAVLLRDPRLPVQALPADWSGEAARALFRSLYLQLSPGAERCIAARFEGVDGCLAPRTEQTEARIAGLI